MGPRAVLPEVVRGIASRPDPAPERLQAPKVKELRLADRAEIARSAVVAASGPSTGSETGREARSVGYFDDGYPAAQLMKADWERLGCEELHAEGRALLRPSTRSAWPLSQKPDHVGWVERGEPHHDETALAIGGARLRLDPPCMFTSKPTRNRLRSGAWSPRPWR